MAKKTYKISFFQLTITSVPNIPTIEEGFNKVIIGDLKAYLPCNGYMYDLWGVTNRNNSFAGQLRKFRAEDLELARPNEQGEYLELDDKFLVEKNHFIYYSEHQLLLWCCNGNASTQGQFCSFLTELWGTKVEAAPIIKASAIRRLMSGGGIKSIDVTIPRPGNAELYSSDNFSDDMIRTLRRAGADSMSFRLNMDWRQGRRSLAEEVKNALCNFLNEGATKAQAIMFDNDVEHPVDLIADRLVSFQKVEHDGNLPSLSMYSLIDDARDECRDDINEYFGEGENTL